MIELLIPNSCVNEVASLANIPLNLYEKFSESLPRTVAWAYDDFTTWPQKQQPDQSIERELDVVARSAAKLTQALILLDNFLVDRRQSTLVDEVLVERAGFEPA